jgi:drug/metabolite transporter (DMT)-like permease
MVSYALSSSAISNSFLLQMEVFYSLILSRIFLEEKVVGKHVVLALLSFVGVGLVLTDGAMKMIALADLLFLLAPLFFQLGHVVAKQMLNEVDPKVIVMYRFLIGGITMLIISVLFGGNPVGISGISGWVVLASCIGFGYSISSSLFYYSIKHINLSKATSILIAYPLVSTVLAIIALGETLSVLKVVGIALVFASTVSLARARTHASAQNRAI